VTLKLSFVLITADWWSNKPHARSSYTSCDVGDFYSFYMTMSLCSFTMNPTPQNVILYRMGTCIGLRYTLSCLSTEAGFARRMGCYEFFCDDWFNSMFNVNIYKEISIPPHRHLMLEQSTFIPSNEPSSLDSNLARQLDVPRTRTHIDCKISLGHRPLPRRFVPHTHVPAPEFKRRSPARSSG
jgi:hypothetical protein